MRISIDTKEDSHEEIRKVIKMLNHLVGDEVHTNQPSANIFEQDTPSVGGMMDMFNTDESTSSEVSSQSLSDNSTEEKKPEEKIQIIDF